MLRVALVGKYVELEDSSERQGIPDPRSAGLWLDDIAWVSSEDPKRTRIGQLDNVDGIIVPGGFGYRGIEGKVVAAHFAREHKVPYLGLCLGMQVMCIEFARHVVGNDEPNSTEFDISTEYPVIDLMPDQRELADMGGTMRLGIYDCQLQTGEQRRTPAITTFGTMRSCRSAIAIASSSTMPTGRNLKSAAWSSAACPRTGASSRSPNWATIRSCLAASSIPNQAGGRTSRIRSFYARLQATIARHETRWPGGWRLSRRTSFAQE